MANSKMENLSILARQLGVTHHLEGDSIFVIEKPVKQILTLAKKLKGITVKVAGEVIDLDDDFTPPPEEKERLQRFQGLHERRYIISQKIRQFAWENGYYSFPEIDPLQAQSSEMELPGIKYYLYPINPAGAVNFDGSADIIIFDCELLTFAGFTIDHFSIVVEFVMRKDLESASMKLKLLNFTRLNALLKIELLKVYQKLLSEYTQSYSPADRFL